MANGKTKHNFVGENTTFSVEFVSSKNAMMLYFPDIPDDSTKVKFIWFEAGAFYTQLGNGKRYRGDMTMLGGGNFRITSQRYVARWAA